MIIYIIFIIITLSLFLFKVCKKKQLDKQIIPKEIDLYKCYSNIVTEEEDKLIEELIMAWSEVSRTYEIKWSTCAGTSLGVHRHQGRIPWDDDVDITIKLQDAKKLPLAFKSLKKKYNIFNSKFWGGHKIFFNPESNKCKSYFKKYKWGWPFIDIFVLPKDKNCAPIKPDEELEWKTFGNIKVPTFKNGSRNYNYYKDNAFFDVLLDSGYRHRIEQYISTKCEPIKTN